MSNHQKGPKCEKCGNEYWDIMGDIAECGNCLTERPFTRRTGTGTHVTKSQKAAASKIRKFFEDQRMQELAVYETEINQDSGRLAVRVETSGHFLTNDGGCFQIGRRGGIVMVYGHYLGGSKEAKDEHELYVRRSLNAEGI